MKPDDVHGLVAQRSWDSGGGSGSNRTGMVTFSFSVYGDTDTTKRAGLLESTGRNTSWEADTFVADKPPDLLNQHGLYAYPLGGAAHGPGAVVGIVELRGRIMEHTDNIYRAGWARILRLFIPKVLDAPDRLILWHQVYGVPMTVTNNVKKSLNRWVKTDGAWAKTHNANLAAQCSGSLTEKFEMPEVERDNWPEKKPKKQVSAFSDLHAGDLGLVSKK